VLSHPLTDNPTDTDIFSQNSLLFMMRYRINSDQSDENYGGHFHESHLQALSGSLLINSSFITWLRGETDPGDVHDGETFNDITSLSGLGEATGITGLEAKGHSSLTDISAISSLTGLTSLDISGSGFELSHLDSLISTLQTLKSNALVTLHLDTDGENDISALSGSNNNWIRFQVGEKLGITTCHPDSPTVVSARMHQDIGVEIEFTKTLAFTFGNDATKSAWAIKHGGRTYSAWFVSHGDTQKHIRVLFNGKIGSSGTVTIQYGEPSSELWTWKLRSQPGSSGPSIPVCSFEHQFEYTKSNQKPTVTVSITSKGLGYAILKVDVTDDSAISDLVWHHDYRTDDYKKNNLIISVNDRTITPFSKHSLDYSNAAITTPRADPKSVTVTGIKFTPASGYIGNLKVEAAVRDDIDIWGYGFLNIQVRELRGNNPPIPRPVIPPPNNPPDPPADNPPNNPPADNPPNNPPADNPPNNPPADNPPADDPPADDPPADDPPADDPPADDPPADDPPADDPPADDPPADDPPATPANDPPAGDPPADDPPATPANDPPAGDPPAGDLPADDPEIPDNNEQPDLLEPESIPKSEPIPEFGTTNYTILPFDYNSSGVGKVVFSEVMLSQYNVGNRRDNLPQWIELYNTTDEDIELKDWKLVGRYIEYRLHKQRRDVEIKHVEIMDPFIIDKPFIIKSKGTVLLSNFAAPNSRDRINLQLENRGDINKVVLDIGGNNINLWNYKGFVLELHDSDGMPIDRIGNLNGNNETEWDIPEIVSNPEGKRVSMIRRLKTKRSTDYNLRLGMTKFGWFPADEVEKLTEGRSEYYYGRWSDIGSPGYRSEDEPLPVILSLFIPKVNEENQVVLNWVTESELDNAGFNIYRSISKDGKFIKVNNKLIQGAGTTGERSQYKYIDATAKPNIEYYYRIEDVSFSGAVNIIATNILKGVFTAENRMSISWGKLKDN